MRVSMNLCPYSIARTVISLLATLRFVTYNVERFTELLVEQGRDNTVLYFYLHSLFC